MDNLPRGYDNWLQAPYQKESDYEYRCCNCDKNYKEDVKTCEICGEKVNEIDNSDPFGKAEPEYNEDR